MRIKQMTKVSRVSGIYGIYILKNNEKNYVYFGSSKDLKNLCSDHNWRLSKNRYAGSNKAILQIYYDNDVQMYFEVVEECENENRYNRLKYYSEKYKDTICNKLLLTIDCQSVETRMKRKGLNKNVC